MREHQIRLVTGFFIIYRFGYIFEFLRQIKQAQAILHSFFFLLNILNIISAFFVCIYFCVSQSFPLLFI